MKKKELKNIIKNKKGALIIPMVPILIAFVISITAALEYFTLTSAYNDIQSIMDLVANSALRRGVIHDIHKDEQIIDSDETGIIDSLNDSINVKEIRRTYHDLLIDNLDRSLARHALVNGNNSFRIMRKHGGTFVQDTTFLNDPANAPSPEIRLEKTTWSNTFSADNRLVDTVILDAVARVDLRTSRFIGDRILEYVITQKNHNGTTTFDVEPIRNDTGQGTSLLIRSSTRMILK